MAKQLIVMWVIDRRASTGEWTYDVADTYPTQRKAIAAYCEQFPNTMLRDINFRTVEQLHDVHEYNVGLVTDNGMHIGYHVVARCADDAEALAREVAERQATINPGSTVQRRDQNGGNEYFDRTFKFHRSI